VHNWSSALSTKVEAQEEGEAEKSIDSDSEMPKTRIKADSVIDLVIGLITIVLALVLSSIPKSRSKSVQADFESKYQEDNETNSTENSAEAASPGVVPISSDKLKTDSRCDKGASEYKPEVDWFSRIISILTLGAAGAAAIIYGCQLHEMRVQIRQSLESFRIDERAWIEIQPISASSNFRYQIYPKNVGKTAATDIKISALRGSANSSITMGNSASQVTILQDKMMGENGALSDVPRVNPISKVLAPNTVSAVPVVMDGQAPQIFPKDEAVSYLIGRIDYVDAFKVPHWLKFCFFVVDSYGNLWNCKEGNDEDRNPELPGT
jgi:hypothetical protein